MDCNESGKPIAIAKKQNKTVVHCKKLAENEGAFEIVQVIDDSFIGPDEEPLLPGTFLKWPLKNATEKLGTSVEQILIRIPGFFKYRKCAKRQLEIYKGNLEKRQCLEVDDNVLIPIPRVDRSNTCPKNLEAKVVSVSKDKKHVELGTSQGIIDCKFPQEQLQKVPNGGKKHIAVPNKSMTLVSAYRLETSYGSKSNSVSICNCKLTSGGHCKKPQCPCFKKGIACATKWHRGKSNCDNSTGSDSRLLITEFFVTLKFLFE